MNADSRSENLNLCSSTRDKFDFSIYSPLNFLKSSKETLKDFSIIFSIGMIFAFLLIMKLCGKVVQLNSRNDLKCAARDGGSVICEGREINAAFRTFRIPVELALRECPGASRGLRLSFTRTRLLIRTT